MLKSAHVLALFFTFFAFGAQGEDETRGIPSITVFVDARLSMPLAQLVTRFTQENPISVASAFGASEEQKKRMEAGEQADLFITSEPQMIQELRAKGMLDNSYPMSEIAAQKPARFDAAVMKGRNITEARKFLVFLRSETAREIFRRNGFSTP